MEYPRTSTLAVPAAVVASRIQPEIDTRYGHFARRLVEAPTGPMAQGPVCYLVVGLQMDPGRLSASVVPPQTATCSCEECQYA